MLELVIDLDVLTVSLGGKNALIFPLKREERLTPVDLAKVGWGSCEVLVLLLCWEFSFHEFEEDNGEGNAWSFPWRRKGKFSHSYHAPSKHTLEDSHLDLGEESFALYTFGGTYYEQSNLWSAVRRHDSLQASRNNNNKKKAYPQRTNSGQTVLICGGSWSLEEFVRKK